MEVENYEQYDGVECEIIDDKTILDQNHLYKIILIGSSGVGKSCILTRAAHDTFTEEHNVTLGVEFGSFITRIDGKLVRIQIWDTAGQESFKSITRIFYKGAHCVLLTYDITREETFVDAGEWLKEVKQYSHPDIKIFLIGNQADKEQSRQVSKEKALEFKSDKNFEGFLETSAKTGQNVKDLFVYLSKMLYITEKENRERERENIQDLIENEEPESPNIVLTDPRRKKDKKSCSC